MCQNVMIEHKKKQRSKKKFGEIVLIPMHCALVDSIYSTRPAERKTIRHVVQSMKDCLNRGEVQEYKWIDTKQMLADILTKESVKSDDLYKVLKTGTLPRMY